MGEWGWFAVVAALVSGVVMSGLALAGRRSRAETARLAAAEGESYNELVLGDMTNALAMPAGSRDRSQIQPELIKAGFYRPSAFTEYLAIRTALVLTPLFAAAALALLLDRSRIPQVALVGLLLAALGYAMPRVYVNWRARRRIAEIERGLPVFADMLALALMAGQSLMSGLTRVADQLRGTFPRMSDELDIVRKQSELLSLNVAFEQWAQRSQIPELQNLSAILSQTQKVGNDVTQVLLEFSTNMRTTLRQRADSQAQRASFWMLFPTILCFWIPAGIVLVGPMFFEFGKRRADATGNMPAMGEGTELQKALRQNDEFEKIGRQ